MKNKILTYNRIVYVISLIVMVSFSACSADEDDFAENDGLSFTVPSPVIASSPGELGEIVITASGGYLPYKFYIIPESQWDTGDKMHEMLRDNNMSILYRYTYTRGLYGSHSFIMKVAAGTQTNPRYYWVAVQDARESVPISGTYLLAYWQKVAVYY